MTRKESLSKKGQLGFSLVEVIVVVAIMAVLGTVLVPQLLHYVNQNRATACQVDREGILAVYERCIYAETLQLETPSLQNMMAGGHAATAHEILEFDKCPLGGTYTGTVNGDLAMIECSCDGHEEVVVDFAMWSGVELAEGIDEPFTEPPSLSVPESDEPTTEEPSSEEEPPAGGGIWPYEDDPRWLGNQFTGLSIVEIDVPVKFTSKEGITYVVTDRNKTGKFPVQYEWSRGPELIDNLPGEGIISCSGVVVTDISTVLWDNPNKDDSSVYLTGIHYGDIIVIDGKEYIYGTLSPHDPIHAPTVDNPGEFYYVGEYKQ